MIEQLHFRSHENQGLGKKQLHMIKKINSNLLYRAQKPACFQQFLTVIKTAVTFSYVFRCHTKLLMYIQAQQLSPKKSKMLKSN